MWEGAPQQKQLTRRPSEGVAVVGILVEGSLGADLDMVHLGMLAVVPYVQRQDYVSTNSVN